MKPLFQHASRALSVTAVSFRPSSRAFQSSAPSICLRCQYRAAATPLSINGRASWSADSRERWSRRSFSSLTRWRDEKEPSSKPIAMPPPSSSSTPARPGRMEDTAPELVSSLEGQEKLQEEHESLVDKDLDEKQLPNKSSDKTETAAEPLPSLETEERLQEKRPTKSDKHAVHDNIARVPDEHLPSHQDKQRWDFSKRLSKAMDELLPKLAVVTQKVNTYTGTDYSGVEALRHEIKEQEKLVKARRAAIDAAKHTLDTATAKQASAQKEVVALLERKHSWADGDLERYMSLIRSEHVNDQAVREAKEAVFAAESALEEARTRLEKRERAQYHEEQIWSDTIRRNSTWVTFVLMGVNIFLLLLSLAILEPWRRRRMVREIKTALEAQKVAMEAGPAAPLAPAAVNVPSSIAAIEAEIDKTTESDASADDVPSQTAAPLEPQVVEVPIAQPVPSPAVSEPLTLKDEVLPDDTYPTQGSWAEKASWVVQDVISDRIILMRRIEYTTAILQGATAGAVIMAAVIAMLRSN